MSQKDGDTNIGEDDSRRFSSQPPPYTAQEDAGISGLRSSSAPPQSSKTVSPHDSDHQSSEENADDQPSPVADINDPREVLEDYDWDELEARFCVEMEKCRKVEEDIGEEFKQWLAVFQAWTNTTLVHEGERAHKRLRTRIAWVQGAEQSLEEKRLHYTKVVQAFESALALLGSL